jgi:glucose/arabinose dehydrogenase
MVVEHLIQIITGQNLNTFLAKIIRIDINSKTPPLNYSIPPDNPFVGTAGMDEIWYYGMRNPWRISFDRQTGDFWIADVGQNEWEEVDFIFAGTPGGLNFGWDCYEGNNHPLRDPELFAERAVYLAHF